jgi:ATP-binding cassette subfamily F protein 3
MSRVKAIKRLKTLEIEQALRTVRLAVPPIDARKSFALRTLRLAIGYGEVPVASDISFEVQRGEKVAVLGENGRGKSTLLKTMAGVLPPIDGTCTWGNRLTVGYYAQHLHDMLDPKWTVLQYLVAQAAAGLLPEDVQRMAGNFLFTVEDVDKPIGVLSGGEKSRLCLAGLLLAKYDVLLLDEPTNHLDVETVEALGAALRAWNGTVFFVSHSRTFVQELATSILDVHDGTVTRYPGSYADYVADVRRDEGIRDDESEEGESSPKKTRAAIHAELSEARRRLKKLEQELEGYTREKEALHAAMAADGGAFNLERNQRLATLEHLLRFTEDEWIRQGEANQELERALVLTYETPAE